MSKASDDTLRLLAAATARYRQLSLQECFDPVNLDSRPTAKQLECLRDVGKVPHRYVTAGNQAGKSQLAARECSWLFTETHPFWKRPPRWGDEPLLILVIGKVQKQVEEVLWRKISAYLDPADYQEVRVGGALSKVVHRKNKNTILFGSHFNEREAREKAQGFVGHAVYLDELPSSVKIIEELHRRVMAKNGLFMATFTPKEPNAAIKALVDGASAPLAKKYQFSMLDNPIYTDADKQGILASLATFPEAYRRTILYGDWYSGDSRVYHFDKETMVEEPVGLNASWRHVPAVDPALQSKFGYLLWAENPQTGVWYLVQAEYIQGVLTPESVLETCEGKHAGRNVVRRVSDPHESWFINTASSHGISYISPWNKNSRKKELIKGLQQALADHGPGSCRIAPWCSEFIREIESCQWSETAVDRIVNSSSFHLLDAAQYFVDCRPPSTAPKPSLGWEADLRLANEKRKKKEQLISKMRVRGRRQYLLKARP